MLLTLPAGLFDVAALQKFRVEITRPASTCSKKPSAVKTEEEVYMCLFSLGDVVLKFAE